MEDQRKQGIVKELKEFLEISKSKWMEDEWGDGGDWFFQFDYEEIEAEVQIVELLLDRALPSWQKGELTDSNSPPFELQRRGCRRAIKWLEKQEMIERLLEPEAPQLSASTLHQWVWDAARSQWASGHFRDAVSAAARVVSNRTQQKVDRRDKSEWNLIQESFSLKHPEERKPRLRLTPDDGGDTFKNLHEGAGFLAQGLFRGIRNPSNHDVLPELTENEALEQLAAFSLLARWIDKAEVVRAV
ncbi:TIGR02391 family protein [Populibacterium corticicola]|uniref:TIGR02391 family protein n=1 Tax=Populibacterium corticicola TaxID=1812826 RepID=A0ABW5XBV4_9MICO